MIISRKDKLFSYAMTGVLTLLLTGTVHAWVAHGGDYHGGYGYHGGYYHGYDGYNAHGVVVGVPAGAYYGYGCANVQKCYPNGCVNERVCN